MKKILIYLFTLLILFSCKKEKKKNIESVQHGTRIEFSIKNPSYPQKNGPTIYIDAAHHNFHTKKGRFNAFIDLVKTDGYQVRLLKEKFNLDKLKKESILVIANPINNNNVKSWKKPVLSAFDENEIKIINKWVKEGGNLLLLADHMPFAGSTTKIAHSFGFTFYDGFAFSPTGKGRIVYRKNSNLATHYITKNIDHFVTFTGQAFNIPVNAVSILILPKGSYELLPEKAWKFNNKTPKIDVSNWSQGAVMKYGLGKIAVFGEAGAFTAQERRKKGKLIRIGMNAKSAKQNYMFVLNLLRWFSLP